MEEGEDDGNRLVGSGLSLPPELLEMILEQLMPEDLFCLQHVSGQAEAAVEKWIREHPPSNLHFTRFLIELRHRGFVHRVKAISDLRVIQWMEEHFKEARVLRTARISLDDLQELRPREYMNMYTWSLHLMEFLETFLKDRAVNWKIDSLLVEQTSPNGAAYQFPGHFLTRFFALLCRRTGENRLGLRRIEVREPVGVEGDEVAELAYLIFTNIATLEDVSINCSSIRDCKRFGKLLSAAVSGGPTTRVARLRCIPELRLDSVPLNRSCLALRSLELLSLDPSVPFPLTASALRDLMLFCRRLTRFHFSGVAPNNIYEMLTTNWPELNDLGLRWEPESPTAPVWFSLFSSRGAELRSLKVWSNDPVAGDSVAQMVWTLPRLQTLDLGSIPSVSKESAEGMVAQLRSSLRQFRLPSSFAADINFPGLAVTKSL